MNNEKQTFQKTDKPQKRLGISDVVALVVGIVVGAGIFRTPSLVAANTSDDTSFFLTWLLGGAVSLIGALSYAELTSTYPHTGGDYHFLYRAYGKRLAFLFAWARMSVIQTGSIALLAFIFGDYAAQVYTLGPHSEVIYAAAIIILLTAINMVGLQLGANAQKLFTLLKISGIIIIIIAGLFFAPANMAPSPVAGTANSRSFGMAMVFVLLTFGGWNEAAYISAELKSGRRSMAKAMVLSIVIITALYLTINYTYIRALGQDVPYVPTDQQVVEAMLNMADVKAGDKLYDLGCGDGRIVVTAAKKYGITGVGIDIDPERIREANQNAVNAGVTDKVTFTQQDLFTTDFSDATVLTLYLLPSVNMKLRPKILDLKPGTRVVSHDFDMGDWKPDKQMTVGGATLYLWTVPEK